MKRKLLLSDTLRVALLSVLLLLGSAGIDAQSTAPQTASAASVSPVSATQAQRFTLANGMTLIVRPDRRAPTAVHMLWVRVGSIDEVDGTSGVAHVLEHMLFKGTPDLKPGEFSHRIAALGGRENAFTSRDATAYHQQVPAHRIEDVMRLEADRFARNQWPDEEFWRELAVVKEERLQVVEELPRARLFEALKAMAFQASPVRRPIIGWMSDIEAMTPQDVRDFYQRWYVPGNAALVIVGDVDVQQVRAQAEQHFGTLAARAVPPRKPRDEPEQTGPRRLEYRAAVDQSLVVLAYKVPRWTGGDDPANQDALALAVLAAVLDGHSGARLERALVRAVGPGGRRSADSVEAFYGLMGRGPQLFFLSAVPAQGVGTQAVEAALKAELARIARDGISPAELARVKTQWMAAEVFQLDSMFNQARELGNDWINGLDVDAGERLMTALRGVTAAQVQSVAQRYFSERQLNTAVLLPDPDRRAGALAARPIDPAR
ncbi:MAG: insulinase family protein [Hydrogenophaga sp.]|nr:insulinase family protein [Hydrogenophaga sp.]